MGNFFDMPQAIPDHQLWMVIVGFIIAFILAFGIGANDVANSFGTSVGSGVLSLRQAFVLACVFETLGAVLLGAKVSDTIRKGIIDIQPYENSTDLLMAGNVAALAGSGVWLIAATLLRLPVSATHSIVGSTVGFALVVRGPKGIHWDKLGMIVGSWFISPVLAGGVSVGLFFVCKYFILNKADPLEPGLRFLPVFYAVTIVVNFFSVFYEGPEMLGFHRIPLWGTFIISFGAGTITAILIRIYVVPWQRKRILADVSTIKSSTDSSVCDDKDAFSGSKSSGGGTSEKEKYDKKQQGSITFISSSSAKTKEAGNGYQNQSVNSWQTKDRTRKSGIDSSIEVKPLMSRTESDISSIQSKTSVATDDCNKDLTSSNGKQSASVNGGYGQRSCKEIRVTVSEDSVVEDPMASGRPLIEDKPETARLFSFLQILTAVFGSFAHGGNDVSNAIGPLVSLWLIGTTGVVGTKQMTPIWILLYGGLGISIGLIALGGKVIKTIGEDLTRITPSSGFCIEIGSALTVLVASNIGIPISTTHCKVGSVVFVGRFRSRENVDWSIFRNIVIAWLVTLPISGGISAAIMAGLQLAVKS